MTRNVSGLGVYMREIAKKLSLNKPMTNGEAAKYMTTRDVPYAAMVLLRLEQRGIAYQVKDGFVRGPAWDEAAKRYKWAD